MADKELSHGQKGNFNDLKVDAVDPLDLEDKPQDARFGLPRFLSWTLKKDGTTEEEYWEATTKNGKIYRIVSDEVKPPKKGKVEIV